MEVVGEAIRTSTTIDSINVDPINVEPISVLEPINVVKGKRTKRQRALSPHSTFPMTITSSSSGDGGGIGARRAGDGYRNDGDHIMRSPTTSFELGENTEEEEDMANCLILLAQGYSTNIAKRDKDGDGGDGGRGDAIMEKFNSRRFTEAATTTNGKAGFYIYECKTCNRCFPSFQALGGHRASHKKPKAMNEEKKAFMLLDDDTQFNTNGPNLCLQISSRGMFTTSTNTNKSKVHECSICGSEFSSGQALGGHMRRHRTTTTTSTTTMNASTMDAIVSESHEPIKKTKSVLSLDLNLPAPEDDRETKFPFNSKTVLSLIDCHY